MHFCNKMSFFLPLTERKDDTFVERRDDAFAKRRNDTFTMLSAFTFNRIRLKPL